MKTRTKNILRQSIRLILSGSMLMTGAADAVLFDHGPSDPTITFPQWYRDEEGLALGLCRSTSTYCFPLTANPAGFLGNIGDEAFYNLVQFVGTSATTGNDFEYRYLGALEASYLPGPTPKHGDETVFARVRITFNFNDPAKNGRYVVTHPFGVHVFENVEATAKTNLIGGQAANFFTVDFGAGQGFNGPLKGPVGPFIKWDSDLPITSGTEQFVGDPTVLHTFTGSPYNTNFLRIDGPVGSNIGGPGIDFIQVNTASVLGQIYTGNIAQPLKIDDAALTRSATTNGIDVWTTSSANQRLLLTGNGMPSVQLKQTSVDNTLAKFPIAKYHAHIEYANTTPPTATPADIKVTNVTSVPVVNQSTALTDVIKIKEASFDTKLGIIKVIAESSDQVIKPQLIVQGIPGLPTAPGITPEITGKMNSCTTNSVEQCFTYTLPAGVEPPERITVISADAGTHNDQLINVIGGPQNLPNPPFITDSNANVFTADITELNLPPNTVIVQQPTSGSIKLLNGVWVFTPKVGLSTGTDSFTYVTKSQAIISNVAKVNLTISFRPAAATSKVDEFAAQIGIAKTFDVLANDVVSSPDARDALNVGSVEIVNTPSKGQFIVNSDGSISYTADTIGVDTFTYRVATSAGKASQPTTVTVTNFDAKETLTVNARSQRGGFKIDGTTTWVGASLSNQIVTCYNGVATNPLSKVIGTSPIDTDGAFQIATPLDATSPAVVNSTIRCQSSNGGIAAGLVN